MSDNIIVSKQDANQVLRLAFDDATQSLRTTTSALTEQTVVQPDGSKLHTTVDASALPTGASTAAKQDTGNTSLASIDGKTPALVTGRVPVDGSGVTQPVSAASLPLPTGASTSALQSTANASLSSIDSKLTSPITVTTGGLTDTQLRASAVPVSGTVSVTGVATAANQATQITSLASIDSKLTSPLSVTGPLTDVQLRATPVPVSMASAPLPSGAATAANQTAQITQETNTANSVASIDTKTPALGQALAAGSVPIVLTAAQLSTLTPLSTIAVTQTTGTNLHTVVDSGTVSVSNFPATQPVSAVSLPLPTGAATETTLAAVNTKTPSLGQAVMAASTPVTLASDQPAISVSQTNTITDLYTTGAGPSQPGINTNILLAVAAATSIDTSGYKSISFQIVMGVSINSVSIMFEGSDDNTNFVAMPMYDKASPTNAPITSITSVASTRYFEGPLYFRYFRVRTAANITAGSIQAFSMLRTTAYSPTSYSLAGSAVSIGNITQGNAGSVGQSWYTRISDGSNGPAAVKASSTAPLATDAALVVSMSPNSTAATSTVGKAVTQLPTYTVYSSTPVTTSAYVQVVASTSAAVTRVSIFDSSGETLILATGAAASEVIKLYVPPGGGEYDLAIPSGTRVSIKALTASATSGYQLINFLT
jgi:hypothetical protein